LCLFTVPHTQNTVPLETHITFCRSYPLQCGRDFPKKTFLRNSFQTFEGSPGTQHRPELVVTFRPILSLKTSCLSDARPNASQICTSVLIGLGSPAWWVWETVQLRFYQPLNATPFLKRGVFWVVTPCGSCKNRRFGGTWRLLHQGDKNR
jgi:hypothetical protein